MIGSAMFCELVRSGEPRFVTHARRGAQGGGAGAYPRENRPARSHNPRRMPEAPDKSARGPADLRSRPTRVALVGAGYIAGVHAEALAEIREVEVVGVCDADHDKAARFAATHGIRASFGSIAAMVPG